MKKSLYLFLIVSLIIVSCKSTGGRIGLSESTGFIELPFPSNSYKPGQIVEVYSRPTKVDITHQPAIGWDQFSSSPGRDIATSKTQEIEGNLSAKIANIVDGEYEFVDRSNVKVSFTDTKTYTIQKSTIYSVLKSELNENSDLKDLIKISVEDGTHFDIITSVISGSIAFSIVDDNNHSIELDSEVIQKINSEFDMNFGLDSSTNTIISGDNLIVGFHKDPKLMNRILMQMR